MNLDTELTIGFARTGVLGYGGGPFTIPLIEYEAVKKYQWMTEDEFGQTLALANTFLDPLRQKWHSPRYKLAMFSSVYLLFNGRLRYNFYKVYKNKEEHFWANTGKKKIYCQSVNGHIYT
jgi:hypothetical protein